jgi:NAD(P)-dependent dehydrogenase (short-subunit alcohol dehydrogenase family)
MAEQQTLPPQTQKQQPGRETEMHPKPDYMPRYPGSGRLEDKVALITGGDSGIGRAVAVLFAREGANVAIMYLNEGEDARETMRIVEAEGRECLAIAGDVGDAGFCEKAIEQVIDRFGRLDVLVNNAAEQHPQKEIDNITPEQIERTFRTNIFGYFFLTQAALPHLKEGASIINTTSVTAYRGSPELLDYSSTKGAIVAKHVASFGAQTPMKRPGQPNEVAPSFLFLACEDSSYITGSVLHPNGGEPTES